MTGEEFLRALADELIAELRPSERIKTFTTNSDVIGAYAEASVRRFVARIVFPLRVCTGAVISEQLCSNPATVPQIDTIIWSPSAAPAIFCAGEFGLVPRGSSFGILEIKRSVYRGVGAKLKKSLQLKRLSGLVADVAETVRHADQTSSRDYPTHPGLGVICVREKGQTDRNLEKLIDSGLAVVLFERDSDELIANPHAVHRLVNFLILTRLRANLRDGRDFVNISLLNPLTEKADDS